MISPLLANIALHGMEKALGVTYNKQGHNRSSRAVVRYADDFVVFCESKEDAEKVIDLLTVWLAQRGLTLSEEKTRIVHLTDGFDFLGWNVRQYEGVKSRTGRKLLIRPSNASVRNIKKRLRQEWKELQGSNVVAVLKRLNPIIRGWANYHRSVVASQTFKNLDNWMFRREVRYVHLSHPRKSHSWQNRKYWGQLNSHRKDNWVFGDKHTGHYLVKFRWYKIRRHVMVKGSFSPDDPGLQDYWARRAKEKSNNLLPERQRLAREQNHACLHCGESLYNGEELHVHHRFGRTLGDVTLVHLYCHQQIHSPHGEYNAQPV